MRPSGETANQRDDAALLAACLDGNEDAWTEMVTRYTRLIYSIAFTSGLNEQDAADVVQNVFTIVLRRLESLRDTDRFSAWLITTARRESWRVKKGKREEALDDAIDPIDSEPTAADQIIAWEEASITHQALKQLGDRCQRLLELLFLHDPRPAYETIAAQLDISIGSIGPIRGRCLKRLKGQLTDLGIVDVST